MPATDASEILLTRDPPVAVLTLNKPGDMNRLSGENLEQMTEMVEVLREAEDIHVVVITGAGDDVFSLGLLNPDIRASLSKDEVIGVVMTANRLFDAIEALPQTVICAINGNIMAGAVELALACDIRVAGSHATLAMPEAKWGGFPGAGAPVRLPMVAGHGRALELIATGREIDAAAMERYGLVEFIHPKGQVLDRALELARDIGANGPLATRGAKRIMRTRREPGFTAARTLAEALRHALEWSEDVDEGMAAHRENRPPAFKGR